MKLSACNIDIGRFMIKQLNFTFVNNPIKTDEYLLNYVNLYFYFLSLLAVQVITRTSMTEVVEMVN